MQTTDMTNLNIRTEKETKAAAEKLFAELGITMTTAVNIFLKQSIRENGIPFSLHLNTPNAITAAAIHEGRQIAYNKNIKGCSSMEELRAALDD